MPEPEVSAGEGRGAAPSDFTDQKYIGCGPGFSKGAPAGSSRVIWEVIRNARLGPHPDPAPSEPQEGGASQESAWNSPRCSNPCTGLGPLAQVTGQALPAPDLSLATHTGTRTCTWMHLSMHTHTHTCVHSHTFMCTHAREMQHPQICLHPTSTTL